MPDLTTKGRDELRRKAERLLSECAIHREDFPEPADGGFTADIETVARALLDQADVGEREWRPIAEWPNDNRDRLLYFPAELHGRKLLFEMWRIGQPAEFPARSPTHFAELTPPARAAAEET